MEKNNSCGGKKFPTNFFLKILGGQFRNYPPTPSAPPVARHSPLLPLLSISTPLSLLPERFNGGYVGRFWCTGRCPHSTATPTPLSPPGTLSLVICISTGAEPHPHRATVADSGEGKRSAQSSPRHRRRKLRPRVCGEPAASSSTAIARAGRRRQGRGRFTPQSTVSEFVGADL